MLLSVTLDLFGDAAEDIVIGGVENEAIDAGERAEMPWGLHRDDPDQDRSEDHHGLTNNADEFGGTMAPVPTVPAPARGEDALSADRGDEILHGGSAVLDGGNMTGFSGLSEVCSEESVDGAVTITDLAAGDVGTASDSRTLRLDDITIDVPVAVRPASPIT